MSFDPSGLQTAMTYVRASYDGCLPMIGIEIVFSEHVHPSTINDIPHFLTPILSVKDANAY
jgi:hypothetical protein